MMIKAYGAPGDIVLLPELPNDITHYELYATILQYNYNAMNIAPIAHLSGSHAT